MKVMETAVKKKEKPEKLLEVLTYEVVDGKPIYYRGYKDILEGKKQPEEVMGSSTLQALLVSRLFKHLLKLEDMDYIITTNEHGIKTRKGYRAVDLGIFRRKYLKVSSIYSDVPPVVAIEVDTKAELENMTFMEYVEEKVKDLFDVGTQKVIWILTKPRIVMVFEKGKEGRILTWDDEVEVLEGVKFKLSDLIQP